jgi:hypothetical protein
MISVLLTLEQKGIVALDIHDCIVVRNDHQHVATEVMINRFEDLKGVRFIVTPESSTPLRFDLNSFPMDEHMLGDHVSRDDDFKD